MCNFMKLREAYDISKGYREVQFYQSLSLQLSEGSFNIYLQVQKILKPQRENLFKVTGIPLFRNK